MLLGMQTEIEEENNQINIDRWGINLSVLHSGVCLYLTGIDDGLELQGGQQSTVDGLLRDGQGVRDIWRRDT